MRQITRPQCKVMQFGALTNKVSLFMNSFLVQQTLLQRSRGTLTMEPVSMQSVCSAQGRPRPTRMSNTLLPMELEMAMSPRPEARRETLSKSVFGRETKRLRRAKLCCATLDFALLPNSIWSFCILCERTLPCHYDTSHAVWDAGARCEEGDAHDDVRDAESKANHSHLRTERHRLKRQTLWELLLTQGGKINETGNSISILRVSLCFCT